MVKSVNYGVCAPLCTPPGPVAVALKKIMTQRKVTYQRYREGVKHHWQNPDSSAIQYELRLLGRGRSTYEKGNQADHTLLWSASGRHQLAHGHATQCILFYGHSIWQLAPKPSRVPAFGQISCCWTYLRCFPAQRVPLPRHHRAMLRIADCTYV